MMIYLFFIIRFLILEYVGFMLCLRFKHFVALEHKLRESVTRVILDTNSSRAESTYRKHSVMC